MKNSAGTLVGLTGWPLIPPSAGADIGTAALYVSLYADFAALVDRAAPTPAASLAYLYSNSTSHDVTVVPGTGGVYGLRIVEAADPTRYLRLYLDAGHDSHIGASGHLYVDSDLYMAAYQHLCNYSTPNYLLQPEVVAPFVIANYVQAYAVDEATVTAWRVRFGSNDVRIAKDIAPVAITQTYSTTAATHAAMTWATIGAFTGGLVGFLDAAERDNLRTQINALAADLINLKGFVNTIADALQASTSIVS